MTGKKQKPEAEDLEPPLPFNEGDRVRLNKAYCLRWRIPEWRDWGHRKGTVIFSDTTRIDVIFDRMHPLKGRQIQAMFTNPDLLEMVPKEKDR